MLNVIATPLSFRSRSNALVLDLIPLGAAVASARPLIIHVLVLLAGSTGSGKA